MPASSQPAMRETARVRRRHVCYLHGFDPRGPAAYHRLFQEEAQRQAQVDGVAVTVGPRRNEGTLAAFWDVVSDYPEGRVTTTYETLRWDDMVRQNWPKRLPALILLCLRYLWSFLRAGFLHNLAKRAWPSFIAILFPPATFLAFGLLLLLVALLVWQLGLLLGLASWLALSLAAIAAIAASFLWKRLEAWMNPCWLARVFGFLASWGSDRISGLAERRHRFAERLEARLRDPELDEILIVGHSIGAQHAIGALADLYRKDPSLFDGGRASFLSLGQCLPLLGALRGAEEFRRDLAVVALEMTQVPWIDVTSPSDPASSCAIDPLAPTGLARPEGQAKRPLQVSPRFHAILTPETFRLIRREPLRFHFQYLMASELPGRYNFFRLTCGPERLTAPGEPVDWTWSKGGPSTWSIRRAG
ncbi:MAG: hypothetical protein AAFY02_06170 [Pseudomonadota bacterium]